MLIALLFLLAHNLIAKPRTLWRIMRRAPLSAFRLVLN
jgi:hypothetical protein